MRCGPTVFTLERPPDPKGKTVGYPSPTSVAACTAPQCFPHSRGINVDADNGNCHGGAQESFAMHVWTPQTVAAVIWPPPLDPTRLAIETVDGEYRRIHNVIQDKEGFLWSGAINGVIMSSGSEVKTIYSGEAVSASTENSGGLIGEISHG